MNTIRKVTIIGGGCVGSFFAKEFYKHGFEIVEIISRRKEVATAIAKEVNAKARCDNFSDFNKTADLYVLSVKDEVIMELRKNFILDKQIIVHTSGSIPIDVFSKTSNNYGILYPLQTISKNRELDIKSIPFFVDANNNTTLLKLENFAKTFSSNVKKIESTKLPRIHAAAVFASNFNNYLLKIAEDILAEDDVSIDVLKPLVEETINKAFDMGPADSQTGPAKRGDCNVTDKHKELLKNADWEKVYTLLSDLIREEYKNK